MWRPKGGTNTNHSKDEKLALVLRNLVSKRVSELEKETGIYHAQIHKWTKQYLECGEEALVNKRESGNSLGKYHRKKLLNWVSSLNCCMDCSNSLPFFSVHPLFLSLFLKIASANFYYICEKIFYLALAKTLFFCNFSLCKAFAF